MIYLEVSLPDSFNDSGVLTLFAYLLTCLGCGAGAWIQLWVINLLEKKGIIRDPVLVIAELEKEYAETMKKYSSIKISKKISKI